MGIGQAAHTQLSGVADILDITTVILEIKYLQHPAGYSTISIIVLCPMPVIRINRKITKLKNKITYFYVIVKLRYYITILCLLFWVQTCFYNKEI